MAEKITVKVNGKTIRAELAEGILSKMKGMRFRSEERMLFEFRKRKPIIDMLFVPTSLQLVFMDEEKQVVDIRKAKPWRFYRPGKPAKYLLESTEPLDVEIGDQLEFEI